MEVDVGSHLVYIGKPMDLEAVLNTRRNENELKPKE